MMTTMNVLKHLLILLTACPTLANVEVEDGKVGLDCSFPIHTKEVGTKNCGGLVGRQQVYEDYMQGCRDHYNGESCDAVEGDRIEMNIRQPQSMVVRLLWWAAYIFRGSQNLTIQNLSHLAHFLIPFLL
jgi:hypothetical protein